MFSTIVAVVAFVFTTFCFCVWLYSFCFDPKIEAHRQMGIDFKIKWNVIALAFVVWFVSGVYLWG